MKLVDVEYQLDGSKITFFFTADERVDFRDLVKDLAGIYKTRIELRQIGVRDEAKRLGGYGSCGRKFCCTTFLQEFEPVTLKMARDQSLSVSPDQDLGRLRQADVLPGLRARLLHGGRQADCPRSEPR